MSNNGLTLRDLETIQQVLKPFSAQIEQVGLFGSRATEAYRPNSDIDLVLYGDALDEQTIDRIGTLFAESSLPYKVDVKAYHLVNYLPLKEHIDTVFQPLPIIF